MKVKGDFVTNSSSTSFIIGNLKGLEESIDLEIKIKVNLKDFVVETIKTIEELILYWKEMYYENFEKDEEYVKCKEIIEKGGVIYILVVSDQNDNIIETLLCNEGLCGSEPLPENLVLIRGEGGY